MRRLALALCFVMLFANICWAGTVDELNAAITAIKNKNTDNAKSILTKLLQEGNASNEHKGVAYYLLSVIEKNTDEAIVYCQKAVEFTPGDARFSEKLGNLYFEKKNYTKAIELLDKSIAITPVNAQAFSMRGLAHRNMGNFDKALPDLDKSISLDPAPGIFYVRRGIARVGAKQPDAALDDFQAAMDRRLTQPLQAICYYHAAKIFQQKGEHDKATQLYQNALPNLTEEDKKLEVKNILNQLRSADKWN